MTSTLVYLGCNKGNGVERLLKTYSFDRVLLVEADPGNPPISGGTEK
jgi:hypothetical protein